MNKRILVKLLFGSILLMVCALVTRTYAGEDVRNGKTKGLEKTMGNDLYRAFDINNIFNWYSNTGDGSYNYITQQSGFFFPKGSSKTATFEDGLVWGGFHKGRSDPSVGGSTYWRGLQAGAILTPGTATDDPVADDPDLDKYRIYVVRPDINPRTSYASVQAKVEAEAALINTWQTILSPQELYDQYIQDWNEWPAKDGAPAPYKDVNGDGRYDPAVDIPGQPGADQTLYYVANDVNSTRTTAFYGSPPIGIEMHRTIWGYNLTGALGNTVFESSLLINKSGAPLDSAYLVQWADVDLGDAGDDYAGCDVDRNLGFTYNGKPYDATYGYQVPATGYTFFQGPIIETGNPSDVAVFRLHYRPGYKNLKMTTFVFFINSNNTYADPDHGAGGDKQWYRLMNGLISSSGSPFIDPTTNEPSKFTLNGDPVAGTGWIDGTYGLIPGDRRQCQVTGPFTLANGDTQEVVVAHLIGLGSDRISSVAVLKWYSDLAQSAYNSLFNISFPPPTPKVDIVALDKEVALNWADSTGIETFSSVGYKFEGYNVYQFRTNSPDITSAVRLATYDLVDAVTTIFDDVYDASTGYVIRKPVEFGTDSGIKRSYETKVDAVNSKPLANGTPYYFGVSSYSFDPTGVPSHLESAPDLLTVTPQAAKPGTQYHSEYGDEIEVTHSAGIADVTTSVGIVDPRRITGNDYEIDIVATDSVYIDADLDPSTGVDGKETKVPNPKWLLLNKSTGATVLPPSTVFTITDADKTVDGLQVGIAGAPFWVAGTEVAYQAYAKKGEDINTIKTMDESNWEGVNWGGSFFDGGLDLGIYFFGSSLLPYQVTKTVEVKFNSQDGQNAYRFSRTASSGGAPYDGFLPQPFKVFDVTDPAHPRQIDFAFEEQTTSTYYDGVWAPGASSGDREYFFIIDEDYTPTEKSEYVGQTLSFTADHPVLYAGWYVLADPDAPPYQDGDVWLIKATNLITTADKWSFSTAGLNPTQSADQEKLDVAKINVFPNPYIGFNPLETDKYSRFVTFSHLPTKATLRIFNLAGVLVRTLEKNSTDQFLQWDLKNESGFPVAAGMYIVYIDMPDVGTTKILKLGVIPEQQYIDRW